MKVTQHSPATTTTIEKSKPTQINPAGKSGSESAPIDKANQSGARVEISDAAKLMEQASDVAKSSPDIRADKVAALKKSILDGTYKIDAQAIADKLVDEHLANDFGPNNL